MSEIVRFDGGIALHEQLDRLACLRLDLLEKTTSLEDVISYTQRIQEMGRTPLNATPSLHRTNRDHQVSDADVGLETLAMEEFGEIENYQLLLLSAHNFVIHNNQPIMHDGERIHGRTLSIEPCTEFVVASKSTQSTDAAGRRSFAEAEITTEDRDVIELSLDKLPIVETRFKQLRSLSAVALKDELLSAGDWLL